MVKPNSDPKIRKDRKKECPLNLINNPLKTNTKWKRKEDSRPGPGALGNTLLKGELIIEKKKGMLGL